jgi:hypothetical protein
MHDSGPGTKPALIEAGRRADRWGVHARHDLENPVKRGKVETRRGREAFRGGSGGSPRPGPISRARQRRQARLAARVTPAQFEVCERGRGATLRRSQLRSVSAAPPGRRWLPSQDTVASVLSSRRTERWGQARRDTKCLAFRLTAVVPTQATGTAGLTASNCKSPSIPSLHAGSRACAQSAGGTERGETRARTWARRSGMPSARRRPAAGHTRCDSGCSGACQAS